MLRAYARDEQMRINLGIRRRLAPLLGNDRRKIELLNALLFSLPGTPGHLLRRRDRHGRQRLPRRPRRRAHADAVVGRPQRRVLHLQPAPAVPAADHRARATTTRASTSRHSSRPSTSLLSWMRQLIALRKRHPVLGRGDMRVLDPENPHVLAFVRDAGGRAAVPVRRQPVAPRAARRARPAVARRAHARRGVRPHPVRTRRRGAYHLTLAPYGFFWFVLEPSATSASQGDTTLAGAVGHVGRRRPPPRPRSAAALAAWLPDRRWFAAKERVVRDVAVEDDRPDPRHRARGGAGRSFASRSPKVTTTATPSRCCTSTGRRGAAGPGAAAGGDRPARRRLARGRDVDPGRACRRSCRAALSKRSRQGRSGAAFGTPRRPGLARDRRSRRTTSTCSAPSSRTRR